MKDLIQERIDYHYESKKDKKMSDDYKFLKDMIILELEHIQKLNKVNKEIESQEKQLKDLG